MIRNNKFFVKKYDEDENKITIEDSFILPNIKVIAIINTDTDKRREIASKSLPFLIRKRTKGL